MLMKTQGASVAGWNERKGKAAKFHGSWAWLTAAFGPLKGFGVYAELKFAVELKPIL